MKVYNGMDLLDGFCLTVIEERDVLDGAKCGVVRERFSKWVGVNAGEEQGGRVEGMSQRYRYCVMVDGESLKACVREAPGLELPDATAEGWVGLVWRDWVGGDGGDEDDDDEEEGEEEEEESGDEDEDHEDEEEEEALNDGGCMRVAYQDVMVDFYALLRDWNAWYVEYRRAPEVARA